MGALDTSIVNVALPMMANVLEADPATVVWVANAYHIASAATMITFAAIGSIIGFKRIFALGLVVFTLSSLGCALSENVGQLIVFRGIQGLSYAALVSVGIGMYRKIFPPNALGATLGINALVVALGTVAGPSVGGLIVTLLGWPWLFLINLPFGIAGIWLALRYLPSDAGNGQPFDKTGAALSIIALASLVVAVEQAGRWPISVVSTLIALSVGCGIGFIRWQTLAKNPLLPLDIFASRRFSLAAATSLGVFTAQGLSFIAFPFLLQGAYGYSAIESALLFTPWPLAVTVAAPLAGRLADKLNATLLSTMGVLCLALGLGATAAMGTDPTVPDILWRIFVCGVGFGFFQAPNNREMLSNVAPSRSGTASGVLATARTLGQSIGAAVVAVVLAGTALPLFSLDEQRAMQAALWLACGIASGSGLLSAKRIHR